MCGIVGYVGNKNATPVLIKALKKLEYRGYDSAGVAIYTGEEILVQKAKGKLLNLAEKITGEIIPDQVKKQDFSDTEMALYDKTGDFIKGCMGIGHTRWATHGEPSDLNSHPHTNMDGSISIVHNGIIENYADLKAKLQAQGIVFKSQTDTEVVVHLLDQKYKASGDIFKAVIETLHVLEGSYAIGVICKDYPDRIIAARKESPLVVGIGKGENFIASDVPALLEHTRDVYYLGERELAVLYTDHVDLFNFDGEKIIKQPSHVEWDMDAATKGGYEHFMIKEIHEQPKGLTDTMRPRIVKDASGKPVDVYFEENKMDEAWKKASRVVITACGTAYHAGVVAKYAFEKIARMKVDVDVASEFRYRDPILDPSDIFMVISQSGETADTLSALRLAKEQGLKVVAITNCVGSTVSREADDVIYTLAGPEIAVASTKAYTTQLLCLFLLAVKAGKLRGTLSDEEATKLLCELESIPSKIQEILDGKDVIQKFASQQFNKDKIFYIGRQFDSATSLESALKLKEVSYMHSEAFAAGELKHGPIALIDPATLVVAIASEPKLYDKIGSNMVEVKSRGATVMVITQDSGDAFEGKADLVCKIPECSSTLASLLTVIPAQLFAYYCAIMRGYNPDKPRNLAKSVTVE
ncbi:glucosamine--fructose-6-phosphate aminotransferase (isomerizing) [Treponema bryantii]|uniref:Glutamine--fructose-6-phosphate aminotransferase [isomerizing] n=1 Tax=Treponema bryantii TaxID=163 RepID=A0A1H9CQL9_9SPIR|nr:glutamine--fructose-6-phosphate transaminase (isomerizing) [Treponema bryantii]SEQ03520.1 glucosamine--fructose-6-phosphate aminotransferase (isomerizing) [Treponema bryantii]